MQHRRSSIGCSRGRRAFTLVEVAVTILLVGGTLVWVLEGLNGAKFSAAQTSNTKLARDLGMLTLGRIQAGLYQEEIQTDRIEGTYADEGYETFTFEVVLGDEVFREREEQEDQRGRRFDNWQHERQLEWEAEDYDEDEQAEEPYQVVQIKVIFPKIQDRPNELILERWIPWLQVYGEDEDAEEEPQQE